MGLDYDKLIAWPFPEIEQTYTERDTILYALGLGYGADPTAPDHLRYVYEAGLEAVPAMATVLAGPGFWMQDPRTGVDWKKIMAAEMAITLHRPIPVKGTVVARMKVTEIYDKGADKGALLTYRRELNDKATGDHLCTLDGSSFLRGNGGFAPQPQPSPQPAPLPQRAPDLSIAIGTLPQAALIYRLSGDYNPLHADPAIALQAGFPKPILHGLCTYAIACRAVMQAHAGEPQLTVRSFSSRFVSAVFPGETIATDIWRQGGGELAFRCRVVERDVVVLSGGTARMGSFD